MKPNFLYESHTIKNELPLGRGERRVHTTFDIVAIMPISSQVIGLPMMFFIKFLLFCSMARYQIQSKFYLNYLLPKNCIYRISCILYTPSASYHLTNASLNTLGGSRQLGLGCFIGIGLIRTDPSFTENTPTNHSVCGN